jgi:hypothetical protein
MGIERRETLLVHVQYGYMLSHDNLVNGAGKYWSAVRVYQNLAWCSA